MKPLSILLLLFQCWCAVANDYTAEIANGGLRARQEDRVAIKKERLFISRKKIRVEYEFLNESDRDVVTEVAFPWPRYKFGFAERTFDSSMLRFSVQVDGAIVPHKTQVKAFVAGDKDITEKLIRYDLNVPFFGYFDAKDSTDPELHGHRYQVEALGPGARQELLEAGAIQPDGDLQPLWEVEVTHHWTQRFPAHRIVKISHDYAPILGSAAGVFWPKEQKVIAPAMGGTKPGAEFGDQGCADSAFWKAASARLIERKEKDPGGAQGGGAESLVGDWLGYILTTAHTWKGPIEAFELIVERDPGDLITFCWDGPIEKISTDRFLAKVSQFRPTKELTVYFCPSVGKHR